MSRIGKSPIKLNAVTKVSLGTEKNIYGGNTVSIEGPKGKLTVDLRPEVTLEVVEGEAIVKLVNATAKAFHGLYRSLIANAVVGVNTPYVKELEIIGIGYKAELQGSKIKLAIGFTHPVIFDLPAGVAAEIKDATMVKFTGIDKQVIGETAAKFRAIRKPEPYKGKGIKYIDEVIKRKEGKAAA